MKKLFVCLAMALMMFAAGVTLSACGSDRVKLTFSVQKSNEPLVKIVVKQNDKEIEGRGYNYNLQKNINLRVEIVAKTAGVDFGDVVVKVNGQTKPIIKNRDYSCAYGSENLTYGNFTLAKVHKDLEVSISGVKEMSLSYDFEVENAEDETAILNMKNAFIDAGDNDQFLNLYDFVTNPQSRLERLWTEENFNSFKLKIGNAERGDDIFDMLNSSAFKLHISDEEYALATYTFTSGGYYIVRFPNVKEKNHTIVVDFKDLAYRTYSVIAPEKNLNYSISAPEFLDYGTTGLVTVSKNVERKSLVFDELKVFINDLELELDADCNKHTDSVLQFVIPDKISPFSTSTYGEVVYTIRVDGISFSEKMHEVTLGSDAEQENMMQTKLLLLDEEGEVVGELSGEDGRYSVAEGERLALLWEYKYDETGRYIVSKYDLFDFDVVVSDVVLAEEETSDPDKEEPGLAEPKFETIVSSLSLGGKIDPTLKETQVVTLADGYVLTAFFDEDKKMFCKMELEFSCQNDKEIGFENFKIFEQDIEVAFDFVDESVTSVEFDMADAGSFVLTELKKGIPLKVHVGAGQMIIFVLGGDAFVDASLFAVDNGAVVLSNPQIETYTFDGAFYTELRFVVSNNQFADMQTVKLVSTRG